MFCPNCGTKNDDKVEKCAQCGFDQKAKKDTKFKGTVMMKGSPGAAPGTPGSGAASASRATSNPALKGTMVGVAPPGLEAIRKQAQEAEASKAPATGSNKFKGTMVGIAPPGLEELRRQHAAGSAPAQTSAAPRPSSKLKGTMIGMAPPEMNQEIAAAKAKMAAQKAAAAATTAGSATETGPANPSKVPSNLKGTMMGVAPPDMQAQIAAARDKVIASREQAVGSLGAGPAPVGMPATDNEPPSEPDPLGGTMVGTSPFAPGGAFGDDEAIAQARASYAPPDAPGFPNAGFPNAGFPNAGFPAAATDFSEDTPAAPPDPGRQANVTAPMIASDPLVAADPMAALTPAAYNNRNALEDSSGFNPPSNFNQPSSFDPPESSQAVQVPIAKASTGPIIFFAVLVILVLAGVAFLVMKGDDDTAADDRAADDKAADENSSPAPAAEGEAPAAK